MESNINNNLGNQENADKQIKLRSSQKQLLESMKLTNKESLADVFDRILEERDQLKKAVEKEFTKTAITKHNESIKSHVEKIIAINADIERQAQDIIEIEIAKYYKSIEEIQETLVILADTVAELENLKVEHEKIITKADKLEKDLEIQVNDNENLKSGKEKAESEKHDYITKFNEVTLDINKLRDQNTQLQSEINTKNNTITSLENDVKNLNTIIATKDTKIENLDKINETLSNDKGYLQKSLDVANETIEKKDQRIAAVTENQQELVQTITALEKELRESNKTHSELETKYQTEKKEFEHIIKDLNNELNKLKDDHKQIDEKPMDKDSEK